MSITALGRKFKRKIYKIIHKQKLDESCKNMKVEHLYHRTNSILLMCHDDLDELVMNHSLTAGTTAAREHMLGVTQYIIMSSSVTLSDKTEATSPKC